MLIHDPRCLINFMQKTVAALCFNMGHPSEVLPRLTNVSFHNVHKLLLLYYNSAPCSAASQLKVFLKSPPVNNAWLQVAGESSGIVVKLVSQRPRAASFHLPLFRHVRSPFSISAAARGHRPLRALREVRKYLTWALIERHSLLPSFKLPLCLDQHRYVVIF